MNTIEPLKAKFEGWICVWGLPFDIWNKESFSRLVARGGLIEIDKQTKDFLVLTEANIRVQNSRIT